ncbi:MAG: DUF4400 domain-containing protein [Acidiferrobacter sp.]
MAAVSGKKPGTTHPLRLLIMVLALELGVVLMVAPTPQIQTFLTRQQAWTSANLGTQAAGEIQHLGARWYKDVLIRTKFIHSVMRWDDSHRYHVLPTSQTAARIAARGHKSLIALWWFLYVAFYRFAMIGVWIPYFIPVLAAALYDGWIRRRIAKWRFEFSSPMRHWYASRGTGSIALVALAVPLLPIPIPPLVIPVFLAGLAVAVRFWMASVQKRI